jgi:hypothetical protein
MVSPLRFLKVPRRVINRKRPSCSYRMQPRIFASLHFRNASLDNPPLPKGRRFLPDSESPSVGSCCWPQSSRAYFTGDPGLAGPWLLHKLGIPMQNSGYRSCKDSVVQSFRSLHLRPEGRGFPRINGIMRHRSRFYSLLLMASEWINTCFQSRQELPTASPSTACQWEQNAVEPSPL